MKAKVLREFTDKYTGVKYKKGKILDIPAKRFNEILEKGKYVEAFEDEQTEK